MNRYLLQHSLVIVAEETLLVPNFGRYSLKKLLVAKDHSLLVEKFLFACCRKCSSLKITRYLLHGTFIRTGITSKKISKIEPLQ